MAPSKSCQLDPLPTLILKDFLPDLLPYITERCNGSLEVGRLPLSQRHPIVQPRLTKATADPEDMKNYRPISNLTFISKVIEKLVCRQISAFLEENNCYQQCSLHTDATIIRRKQQCCVRHTLCSRSRRCDISLPLGSVRRFRHGWPLYLGRLSWKGIRSKVDWSLNG